MSKKKYGRALLSAAVVATMAVGLGTTGTASAQAANKSPITIGLLAEFSVQGGGSPSVVTSSRAIEAGIAAAFKMANDAGGVAGHPLRYKIYDGGSSPTTSSVVTRQAISDKPELLAGFLNSVDMSPQVPLLQQSKIPFVYAGTFFSPLNEMTNMFTVNMSTTNIGQVLAKAVKARLGTLKGKNIAFEGLAPSLSIDDTLTAFKRAVKAEGGGVTRVIRDPSTLNSWSSQAANIMNANVDAVVSSHSEAGTTVIGKALKVSGYRGPVVAVAAAATDATLKAVNMPNFYGLRESDPPGTNSQVWKAVLAAHATTSRVLAAPSFAAKGYVIGWDIYKALQKCGTPCPWAKFPTVLRSLGAVSPPGDPFFSPVNFGISREGIVQAALVTWDDKAGKTIRVGSLLSGS